MLVIEFTLSILRSKILRQGSTMIYYLPRHTSGDTQPIDVKLLDPYIGYFKVAISVAIRAVDQAEFKMFYWMHLITKTYRKA